MNLPISYELFRLIVWGIGLPVIALLIWRVSKRLKDIRELDAKLRREEAATAANPYAQMAALYETQEILEKNRLFGKWGAKKTSAKKDEGE